MAGDSLMALSSCS